MIDEGQPESTSVPAAAPRVWRLSSAFARLRAEAGALRRVPLRELIMRSFSIPQASAIFMIAFLLSAVLGIVRQVLFNAQFGAGSAASAYYAAFRLPDTLASLIAGGALSSAMIPVLLRTSREEGEAAEFRLINLVLTTLLALFVPVTALSMLATPLFVEHVLAPGFDAETSALTVTLTRIMLIQPPIVLISSVAFALLNSRNQFMLTGLSIVCHNITLIGGILAAGLIPGVGIYGPTIGVVSDAILQLLILLPGVRGNRFRLRPAWHLADRRLREVIRLLIPNGLSMTVNYAGTIVDTAFASLAREAAGLPAVHNAFLLVGFPIRLLGLAVGQAAFPRLAAHAAAHNWAGMRRTLVRSLGAAIGLAVPIAIGLVVLGRMLIRLLFEHGRFDAAAGDLTYAALAAYLIGLPAYIGTEIATRGLIALYDTRTPLFTNIVQVVGRIAIIALLLEPIGVVAVPIAFAITSTIECLILSVVLFLRISAR